MPLHIKHTGVWQEILAGTSGVSAKNVGVISDIQQIYVNQSGTWVPIWGSIANLTSTPRWGVGQFADTDFTGGKTNPNQAGLPYDVWTGPQDFIDSVLTNLHGVRENGVQVDVTVPFPDYAYFAHPISMGDATFTDNNTGSPGGWNGAGWTDGGFNGSAGPLLVTYDDGTGPSTWAVYRTDFSGIGTMSWTVNFSNVV